MITLKQANKIAARITKQIRKDYANLGIVEKPYVSPKMVRMVLEEYQSVKSKK